MMVNIKKKKKIFNLKKNNNNKKKKTTTTTTTTNNIIEKITQETILRVERNSMIEEQFKEPQRS